MSGNFAAFHLLIRTQRITVSWPRRQIVKPRIYSSRFLQLRRKVINAWNLIWGYDGSHARYWSNLDHQERHSGNLFFAHKGQAESPLHQHCTGQQFVHRLATPWYRVPFSVWIAEIKYRVLCRMPHPEWNHAPKQGTRAPLIKSIAGSILKWIRDLFLPNVPGFLGALIESVGTAAGRLISGHSTCQLHKISPHMCVHCAKYGIFRPKQRVAHVHCQ